MLSLSNMSCYILLIKDFDFDLLNVNYILEDINNCRILYNSHNMSLHFFSAERLLTKKNFIS